MHKQLVSLLCVFAFLALLAAPTPPASAAPRDRAQPAKAEPKVCALPTKKRSVTYDLIAFPGPVTETDTLFDQTGGFGGFNSVEGWYDQNHLTKVLASTDATFEVDVVNGLSSIKGETYLYAQSWVYDAFSGPVWPGTPDAAPGDLAKSTIRDSRMIELVQSGRIHLSSVGNAFFELSDTVEEFGDAQPIPPAVFNIYAGNSTTPLQTIPLEGFAATSNALPPGLYHIEFVAEATRDVEPVWTSIVNYYYTRSFVRTAWEVRC